MNHSKTTAHPLLSPHQLIDLTHTLSLQTPTWNGACGFKNTITEHYNDSPGPTHFQVQQLEMRAGIGTHMDAPAHCIQGGSSIADIAIAQFIIPLVVLDVSERAHANYQLAEEDIVAFEKNYGRIPSQCLVIVHTGWARYWHDPILYRNADAKGKVHFPTVSEQAAQVLLARGIYGLAIDTLSLDLGTDGYFPTHEIFLGAGKYLVENVANAHLLPTLGALGIILPMKILEGTEAPVRFVAVI